MCVCGLFVGDAAPPRLMHPCSSARGDRRSYFETLRRCAGAGGRVGWVVGSDVVLGMRHWAEKAQRVRVLLLACAAFYGGAMLCVLRCDSYAAWVPPVRLLLLLPL